MWRAEEFRVLHGKYSDTQPQRYLETQPMDKRKRGFLSGRCQAVMRVAGACRRWERGALGRRVRHARSLWASRHGRCRAHTPLPWGPCCWQAMPAKETFR